MHFTLRLSTDNEEKISTYSTNSKSEMHLSTWSFQQLFLFSFLLVDYLAHVFDVLKTDLKDDVVSKQCCESYT